MIGALRATARLMALAGLTLALLPVHAFARTPIIQRRIVRVWHKGALKIVGLKLRIRGAPPAAAGALIVANHVSYLDICALGASFETKFVAKAAVGTWPLIGPLARRIGTLLVERDGSQCPSQIEAVTRILESGETAVVFPEGTSSLGKVVLPFKSTLFEAAMRAGAQVQPVSIAYAKDKAGQSLAIEDGDLHPFVGDQDMAPHLWRVLRHPGATADIVFHPPQRASDFASRKALTQYCQKECSRGLVMARRRSFPWNNAPRAVLTQDWVNQAALAIF
jgi:1-acyl-sn-glycerol-3-phosphate acyltransferase